MIVREVAEGLGIEIEERNFNRVALTEAELRELIEVAGGVAAVISPRNKAVKAAGWSDAPPDVDTFVAAAAQDNKMIRRPVLVVDDRVVVGNKADEIRQALGG